MEVTPSAQLEKYSKGRAQIRCGRAAVTEHQRETGCARSSLVKLCNQILSRTRSSDLSLPSVNSSLTTWVPNA
jgi:hypothetical protein